ncbi:hypothetical protein Are01nite_19440 [Actinoplanes regularis]|nr:hypothetical protein Are01nite_19440 [Actinoplanes regularis]
MFQALGELSASRATIRLNRGPRVPTGTGMTRRGVWALILLSVVVFLVRAFVLGPVSGHLLYFAFVVPLCGVAWWAALRPRRDNARQVWGLLALTLNLTVAGDCVQAWQHYFGEVPVVGLADVLWLISYAPQITAMAMMARRRGAGQLSAVTLDALTMTTAAALGSYLFFIEPLFADGGTTLLETIVPAAYPICDVLLLAAVLVLLFTPGRRGAPVLLQLASAGLGLTANVAFNLLPSVGADEWVGLVSNLAVVGLVLMAAVVLHPDRGELTVAGAQLSRMHPARLVFLGVALLTAPVLGTVRTDLHTGERIAVLVATAVCSALVLIRFMIAVREQERGRAQLAVQARLDPLTGLANRTVLGEILGSGGPAVLLYLDLDGFKAVNDLHGHEAGDAVLTAIAARISTAVRADDLVARIGGDEFVVACPGASMAEGTDLAERILRAVAPPVPFAGERLVVGASVGIAMHDGGAGGSTGALRAADEAMYQAKRLGRGRWVLAGTGPSAPAAPDLEPVGGRHDLAVRP